MLIRRFHARPCVPLAPLLRLSVCCERRQGRCHHDDRLPPRWVCLCFPSCRITCRIVWCCAVNFTFTPAVLLSFPCAFRTPGILGCCACKRRVTSKSSTSVTPSLTAFREIASAVLSTSQRVIVIRMSSGGSTPYVGIPVEGRVKSLEVDMSASHDEVWKTVSLLAHLSESRNHTLTAVLCVPHRLCILLVSTNRSMTPQCLK